MASRAPARSWHCPPTPWQVLSRPPACPPPPLCGSGGPRSWKGSQPHARCSDATKKQGPASCRFVPVRRSLEGALGKTGGTAVSFCISLPSIPWAAPLAAPSAPHHLPLPPPHPPRAGFSELSSPQSLVGRPCLFIPQPVVLLHRPHGNSPGSPAPSPGTVQNLPLPSPSPCWKPDREGVKQRARAEDARAGPAPCTSPLVLRGGAGGGMEQAPGCRQHHPGQLPGLAQPVSAASWPCSPAGPPQDHPPESPRARGYLPTPRLPHPNCPPGLRPCQAPTAAPAATANCRPISIPSAHPQPSFQNATASCQHPSFPSPGSHRHPLAEDPGLCIPDLPSRTKAGPHLLCSLGGAVPGSGGREPEEHLGAKGLADGGKGRGENRTEVEGRQQSPWC